MARLRACLSFVSFGATLGQIAPKYAGNLTVYHLNPANAGAIPLNMNTGDASGDLYFYLGQFLLPVECDNASAEGRAHFDCDNPERVDPNRVVTQVDMQVDTRWTDYSACNLCNGTDPFSHKKCEDNTYTCDCSDYGPGGGKGCNRKKVGRQNVAAKFAPVKPSEQCNQTLYSVCGDERGNVEQCFACVMKHQKDISKSCVISEMYGFCPSPWNNCSKSGPSWMCYAENIPRKTNGLWYSTLKEAQCNETSPVGSCSWKVLHTKTIKDDCLKKKLMATVESHDPGCFSGCGPRNVNSSCYIGCFFDTILGKEAAYDVFQPLGGMDIQDLQRGWTDAFLPPDQGGCEEMPIPVVAGAPLWTPDAAIVV